VRGEIAVMLMDLDGFKEINDTLGHQSGDTLLAEVGARLSRALGRDGIVARLGGDEFGVVVAVTSPSTVPTIVDRIRRALDRPYVLRGLPIRATASIGVSLYPEHGVDPGALLKHADVALYLAKESHGPYALYNPERDTNDARRLALVAELKQAIERGEIVLLFQPQADLRTGRILSVESLVRWRHPERGLLAPDEFVPLAERTGLIKPLSRFVLGEALRQCAAWHREGLDLRVAVNLTMPDLLDLELPRDIGTLLAQLALDPDKLELEMTESTVMADPARVRQVLEELHGMGVRLAIDDFGTGYSSLAYLKRLPARKLKIDKSFVLAMEHDASDATIVRSTIELGHNLGLEVVAEGVETPEVWRTLQQYGCDFAQGFLIGHPMYAEGVADLVRARGGTAPAGPDHGEPQPAPRHLAAVS
jgi:diguanylate cyclase (GGDEF)-like protein